MGQFLDLSLQASQVTWLTSVSAAYFATGELPEKVGNAHPSIAPYGVFQARDGCLILAAGTHKLWLALCQALDAQWLADDKRFVTNVDRVRNKPALTSLMNDILAQREVEYWLALLQEVGVPCGPILNVAEALEHPQILHREMIVHQEHPTAGHIRSVGNPIRFSHTPVQYPLPPPLLGQHTEKVLAWLGYSQEAIERLRQEQAI
jgi:crotonobetainyl-CoA:carnitine CoA-transferase CaiB-like acyl-CoA transferase